MISSRCDRRQGFSLIEMLIVIVVVGLVTLSGWPRLRDAKIRSDVRSARGQVIGLYAKARASAVETARPTTLQFSGTSAWIQDGRLRSIEELVVSEFGSSAPGLVVPLDPHLAVELHRAQDLSSSVSSLKRWCRTLLCRQVGRVGRDQPSAQAIERLAARDEDAPGLRVAVRRTPLSELECFSNDLGWNLA
jgi:prepilin-type N-terminal cleavage/methylation domain-containing protein